MNVVLIPTRPITDWSSFHDVFAAALGFPDFYGRNLDAWIDCLTYADEDDGMRLITVAQGQVLTLQLEDVNDFADRCPAIFSELLDCVAFVNWRRIERGDMAVLAISYYRST